MDIQTFDPHLDLQLLSDPDAVHAMLLRGAIARPSLAQMQHLYGVSISGMQEKIERLEHCIKGKDATIDNLRSLHSDALAQARQRIAAQDEHIKRLQRLVVVCGNAG